MYMYVSPFFDEYTLITCYYLRVIEQGVVRPGAKGGDIDNWTCPPGSHRWSRRWSCLWCRPRSWPWRCLWSRPWSRPGFDKAASLEDGQSAGCHLGHTGQHYQSQAEHDGVARNTSPSEQSRRSRRHGHDVVKLLRHLGASGSQLKLCFPDPKYLSTRSEKQSRCRPT